jgi:hypothetical protein
MTAGSGVLTVQRAVGGFFCGLLAAMVLAWIGFGFTGAIAGPGAFRGGPVATHHGMIGPRGARPGYGPGRGFGPGGAIRPGEGQGFAPGVVPSPAPSPAVSPAPTT